MRRALLTTGILFIVFLLSGCSGKVSLIKDRADIKGKKETVYIVEGAESWRSPSAGYNISTRNAHLLLNAAKATKKEGKKYFAIYKPDALSNIGGSMINTPEEFVKECLPTSANIFNVGNERCGLNGKSAKVGMVIMMFDEEPIEYTTYDAEYVIDYMNQNGYDREDSWDEFKDTTKP